MKNKIEWKEVEIGDLANFLRGPFGSAIKKSVCVEKGKNTYKLYEQGNIISNNFIRGSYYIDEFKFNQLKKFELLPKDLVITCAGTIGKIAIVPPGIERGIINSVLMRIRINHKLIDSKLFIYLFRSPFLQNKISSQSQGVAVKNLFATKELKKYTIKLPFSSGVPDLKEQERIVKILENAEKLKERSKKARELLDEYLKSVFNEMFYNKGFEEVNLGEVAGFNMGGTPQSSEINSPDANIPWIKGSDLEKDRIFSASNFITELGMKKSRAKYYLPGTVLIGRAGQGKTRATTALLMFKATTNETMIAILPKHEGITSEYIHFNLKSRYKELRDIGGDNTRGGITQGDLRLLKIPLPPLPLQQKFANVVEHVEKMKEKIKSEEQKSEELFNSLMQKAFRGDL